MARRRSQSSRPPSTPEESPNTGEKQQPEAPPEPSPEIATAAEAVRHAEAELQEARTMYEAAKREATQRLKAAREKTVGDLLDGTVAAVRKYPGPALLVATLIGFFLGRLFRR